MVVVNYSAAPMPDRSFYLGRENHLAFADVTLPLKSVRQFVELLRRHAVPTFQAMAKIPHKTQFRLVFTPVPLVLVQFIFLLLRPHSHGLSFRNCAAICQVIQSS